MNNRCGREDANLSCLGGQHVNSKTIMSVCHMSYAGSKWSNSVEALNPQVQVGAVVWAHMLW